ncbi:Monocarboxylate transporter 9 [Habropoda laboriosa]|uniref:Monocarboxylate transporter 9 n=1 Tax=Habropoda laboriosa TaxID=597456 RepID=A0A0L7QW24_9HYME|nr:Monocarboxylate transporter 9 [Habropoda laboriosa]
MSTQESTKVPPDGKWGWMIVLAYAINGRIINGTKYCSQVSTLSVLQGFVLVFKDTFPLFGFNATQGAIIINTNLAFGMILGLINGPLLRCFGYRKMAMIGSLMYSIGVTATAFVTSFTLIMLFYGIFASLGTCITTSAFSYALNSYFTSKRSRAMSLAVTLIGLGPIIVPQVTTFLISYYGFQGTILLYGAFSLHSLVGSMLLHPLKWHTKDAIETKVGNEESLKNEKDEKNISFQDEESLKNSVLDLSNTVRKRRTTVSSIDHNAEIGSIYGIDIPYARQMSESLSVSLGERELDMYRIVENGQAKKEHSMKIFEEKPLEKYYSNIKDSETNNYDLQRAMESNSLLQINATSTMSNIKTDDNEKYDKKKSKLRICSTITELFDLDLLRDPIYVNLMLGMSIAIFAEVNFSQLTPFILMDMKLSTNQIAAVMSIIASVDLVFRILAPFLGEWLNQPPRIMYLISLCFLIFSRSSLLFVSGFFSMISVAVGLGVAKGIRSVYMSLVIPSYVPIQRLPNAAGIQMIMNGVILLTGGPMLGIMRDRIGSYTSCIIMINCITAFTVIIWTVEILIVRSRKSQEIK